LTDTQNNFTDPEAIQTYIQNKEKGGILITYRNCKEYEGMVLSIMIAFDTRDSKYQLDLQWMSLGLDFYGDTLQETYLYQFENLEKLLEYILAKYAIRVTDIPLSYSFDSSQFPNPIKDKGKKIIFEAAWQQFQSDFKMGAFLDTSLKLVYTSGSRS